MKAKNSLKNSWMGNRKAVLFTIILVFFSVILFSLSTVIIKQRQNENFFIQGSIDRITNLDAGIQKSITDLIKYNGRISLTINANNVTITQDFPQNFSLFKNKLEGFKNTIKNEIPVTISHNIQEMSFNISPSGIVYSHKSNFQKAVITNIESLRSIKFNLTFAQGGEGACPIVWNDVSNGSLRIIIYAKDVITSCSSERNINPSGESEVILKHTLGDIKMEIEDGKAEISREGSNPFTSEVKLELPVNRGAVSIRMPEITTNVSVPDFRIIGEARFLT